MNHVTLLSREIVNEIQDILNHGVSVSDYIEIRKEAMNEILKGCNTISESKDICFKNNAIEKTNLGFDAPITEKLIVNSTVPKKESQLNEQGIILGEPGYGKGFYVQKEEPMPWETDNTNETSDNDSDFFAMCDAQGE